MKKLLSLILVIFSFNGFATVDPVASIAYPSSTPLSPFPMYGKFEVEFSVIPDITYSNPYDADDIDIYAVFTAPDASTRTVNAFWYVSYSRCTDPSCVPTSGGACTLISCTAEPYFLTETTNPHPWRIRFAPDVPGNWTFQIYVRSGSSVWVSPTSAIDYSLSVAQPIEPGFIKVDPIGHRNFIFNDGGEYADSDPLIPREGDPTIPRQSDPSFPR